MPDYLEVEVKFWVAAHTAVRQSLLSLHAQLTKPRVFERNLRLDGDKPAVVAGTLLSGRN